jgi:excisionase family DNA binding protein
METNAASKCLTTAETAVARRVSAPTIYRWIRQGQLPAAKIGKSYFINQNDVDRLLRGAPVAGDQP